MQMTKLALSAAVLAALASPAHAAKSYEDSAGRFSVNLPTDWEAVQPEGNQVAVVMGKKQGNEVQGVCIVVITETPQTASKPQADVDVAMSGMLTKEFWQATYKAQGAQDIVISQIGTRDVPGRKVHFVTSEFTNKGQNGSALRMKAKEEVHALPGRMHDIGCLARSEKYASISADFESVFKSYTPLSGLVAQAPTPPVGSMLTLFAKADFDGAARVVKSETPNITYVSWPILTGSVMVSGFGEWQVCEGADFSGTCTVLSGAYSPTSAQLLRIGSVRPLGHNSSLGGAASTVSTNSIRLLTEAMKQF